MYWLCCDWAQCPSVPQEPVETHLQRFKQTQMQNHTVGEFKGTLLLDNAACYITFPLGFQDKPADIGLSESAEV